MGKSAQKDQIGDEPYHLLAYHCLDVAACSYLMVQNNLLGVRPCWRHVPRECGDI
ncbi:HD domain-containing protein [Sodalis ligni]|uniref:HD domain-containing protein n=1 Tax=Sodalis ligni TaxID=2697027 RepID=UPI002096E495|nr:HD domain-containing protein [Sodalis ligni]